VSGGLEHADDDLPADLGLTNDTGSTRAGVIRINAAILASESARLVIEGNTVKGDKGTRTLDG
jgi:hypothetical protein